MNRQEIIAHLLKRLADRFKRTDPITEVTVANWMDDLEDYTDEQIVIAQKKMGKLRTDAFFPTPAEFIEYILSKLIERSPIKVPRQNKSQSLLSLSGPKDKCKLNPLKLLSRIILRPK